MVNTLDSRLFNLEEIFSPWVKTTYTWKNLSPGVKPKPAKNLSSRVKTNHIPGRNLPPGVKIIYTWRNLAPGVKSNHTWKIYDEFENLGLEFLVLWSVFGPGRNPSVRIQFREGDKPWVNQEPDPDRSLLSIHQPYIYEYRLRLGSSACQSINQSFSHQSTDRSI